MDRAPDNLPTSRSHRSSRWPIALLAALGLAVGSGCALLALFWPVARTLADTLADDPLFVGLLARLLLLALLAALVGALVAGVRWLHARASLAGVVQLQHGQPIHVHDLRAVPPTLLAHALDRHYDVQQTQAAHSALANLTSLHLTTRPTTGTPATPPLAVPTGGAGVPATGVLAAPRPLGGPVLATLQARGLVGTNARHLLVGLEADQPHTIALDEAGFVAIAGQPRVGKSSTAAWLVAQAALAGWHVALCDPHGHQPDGLLQRAAAVSGACIRQAITPEEIIATIQLVDKIGARRLAGDVADTPVLLVIDEFTRLVLRGALPEAVLAQLTAMAMEYAKVSVHGIIIGQDWSYQLLGPSLGAPLRRAITHRVLHRCDAQNAEFLLPDVATARQVATLEVGSALFWGRDLPAVVRVPELTPADLRYAARGIAPQPYAPRPSLPTVAAAPPRPLPPPAAPTLDGRILTLLAGTADELDARTIARALSAEIASVRNVLTELSEQGRVMRLGNARSYRYRAASSSSPEAGTAPDSH